MIPGQSDISWTCSPVVYARRRARTRVYSIPTLLAEAELAQMVELADSDRDGNVSFEDFYAIMSRASTLSSQSASS